LAAKPNAYKARGQIAEQSRVRLEGSRLTAPTRYTRFYAFARSRPESWRHPIEGRLKAALEVRPSAEPRRRPLEADRLKAVSKRLPLELARLVEPLGPFVSTAFQGDDARPNAEGSRMGRT
jgi:hypothetical protein